jgi:hypothetical protein
LLKLVLVDEQQVMMDQDNYQSLLRTKKQKTKFLWKKKMNNVTRFAASAISFCCFSS